MSIGAQVHASPRSQNAIEPAHSIKTSLRVFRLYIGCCWETQKTKKSSDAFLEKGKLY